MTRRVISCAKLLDFEDKNSKTLKTERTLPSITLEPKDLYSYATDSGDPRKNLKQYSYVNIEDELLKYSINFKKAYKSKASILPLELFDNDD